MSIDFACSWSGVRAAAKRVAIVICAGEISMLNSSQARSEDIGWRYHAAFAVTWHVQYREGEVEHLSSHPSPEKAIETACRLIDGGCDVYGIGTGALANSISKEQIARIYKFWARPRYPFGDSR